MSDESSGFLSLLWPAAKTALLGLARSRKAWLTLGTFASAFAGNVLAPKFGLPPEAISQLTWQVVGAGAMGVAGFAAEDWGKAKAKALADKAPPAA